MNAVIFATYSEAAPMLKALRAGQVYSNGDLHLYRPRCKAYDVAVIVSGMGRKCAQAAAEYAVTVIGATRIVSAGIAGALKESMEPGMVYAVKSVGSDASDETFIVDQPGWQGLRSVSLITVDEPVFKSARRDKLAAGYDLVDMEGHAVSSVCHNREIPCVVVKGVSDFADESGRDDLAQSIDEVSGRVSNAVLAGLGIETGTGAFMRLTNFIKVEHTIFSLPLLLAGAWIGAGGSMPGWRVTGLVFMAGLGARTLGMSMNRILDRDIDAVNERTAGRELPSGRMSLLHAYSVAAAGLVIYLLACAGLGRICLYLAPVPLIPLGLYSLLKRFTPLCHFGIGVCLALAPLGAYVAASGDMAFDRQILLLALYAFCWISGFDVIYALQDAEFDRRAGVKSLPAALGTGGSALAAGIVHLVGVCAAAAMWYFGGGGLAAGFSLFAVVVFTLAGHMPFVPLPERFFPCSAVAGVAGAMIPLLGGN